MLCTCTLYMPVQVRAGVAGESYLYKLCIYAGNENYINPDWTHKCDACLISFEWESAQSAKFNAGHYSKHLDSSKSSTTYFCTIFRRACALAPLTAPTISCRASHTSLYSPRMMNQSKMKAPAMTKHISNNFKPSPLPFNLRGHRLNRSRLPNGVYHNV